MGAVEHARAKLRAGNAMRGIAATAAPFGALGQPVFMAHPDALRMLRNARAELDDAIAALERD